MRGWKVEDKEEDGGLEEAQGDGEGALASSRY